MGRYERETHARYRPDGKCKIHDKIEKRKWICNTDLRINVKLVRVYYEHNEKSTPRGGSVEELCLIILTSYYF